MTLGIDLNVPDAGEQIGDLTADPPDRPARRTKRRRELQQRGLRGLNAELAEQNSIDPFPCRTRVGGSLPSGRSETATRSGISSGRVTRRRTLHNQTRTSTSRSTQSG